MNLKHDALEPKYRGKVVCYNDNGMAVYGMCNEIALEWAFGHTTAIIQIGNGRYECDYEYLDDHIKILG